MKRLKICKAGVILLSIFLILLTAGIALHVMLFLYEKQSGAPHRYLTVLLSALVWTVNLSILFWIGILCVYSSSVQLGLKHRIWGILLGWVFPANIIAHSKGGLDARYAISKCGISHGDMIDLNKENFEGFDVREFYVQLVSDLRQMGM